MRTENLLTALGCLVLLSGCANTYTPPKGFVNMDAMAGWNSKQSPGAMPAARFPATIAAIRIQAPQSDRYYTDMESGYYRKGRYTFVPVLDAGDDPAFQPIATLRGVASFNRIQRRDLPPNPKSPLELRQAAARVNADVLFLYTVFTHFHENNANFILRPVPLGVSPPRRITARVTATALIIDARTGYVYTKVWHNTVHEIPSESWASRETAERARLEAEEHGLRDLVDNFGAIWPAIAQRGKQD